RECGRRAELFELPHHSRFGHERRAQSANHFEQEIVSSLAGIGFRTCRKIRNECSVFRFVKEDDSTETGPPLEAIDSDRRFLPSLGWVMQNYEIVQHGIILGGRYSR